MIIEEEKITPDYILNYDKSLQFTIGPVHFTLPLTLGESLSLDLDFLQVPP